MILLDPRSIVDGFESWSSKLQHSVEYVDCESSLSDLCRVVCVLPVGPHDANGTRRYPHEPR
jgi:hypothetical protein